MLTIIKQTLEIIGEHESSRLGIVFYGSEIVFNIYESEVPIMYRNGEVYLDCELCDNNQLTPDMLQELTDISKLLRDNTDILEQLITS